MGRLDELDLSLSLSKKEEAKRLETGRERLTALRLALGGKLGDAGIGPGVLILMEGWDASGKGGAIRRLTQQMDPRHFRVVAFSAPTPDEKRHHFLWRFFPVIPGLGGLAVFDRTWYGRVLVERVEGFASVDEWERGYGEIADMERSLALNGTIIIKFWLHLSEAEQLSRFEARRDNPLKQWKLTDEDWRNREKRADYERAVEDMLERTDHELAPWHLVEGDSKRYARVKILETTIAEIERGCTERGYELPEAIVPDD